MIRRHLMVLRLGLMAADGASAALVFLLISLARFGDGEWIAIWDRLGIDIRVAATLFGISWVVALWVLGLYRLRSRWRLRTELVDILRATVLVAAFSLSALFVFKEENVSRSFLLILFTVQPLVTFAGRAILRAAFERLRARGRNTRSMLVVGTGHFVLRQISLDELPPFWNVLKGDMSLVGPRPPLPGEVRERRVDPATLGRLAPHYGGRS